MFIHKPFPHTYIRSTHFLWPISFTLLLHVRCPSGRGTDIILGGSPEELTKLAIMRLVYRQRMPGARVEILMFTVLISASAAVTHAGFNSKSQSNACQSSADQEPTISHVHYPISPQNSLFQGKTHNKACVSRVALAALPDLLCTHTPI